MHENCKKYPRTPHLPWSAGVSEDDIRHKKSHYFKGKNVIVTEKMDGENTSIYKNYIHARSIDGRYHPSRDWVKAWYRNFAHEIPDGWRICGENLFAQHSIGYASLKSYFYGFSVWNAENICLNWQDTSAWFTRLDIEHPPILYQGNWDEKIISGLQFDEKKVEGYVVRITDAFKYEDFNNSVAKYVRSNHVQTDEHWMHKKVIQNG